MTSIGVLDRSYNPVGLWLFDGNLRDTSGNGLDLTVAAGTFLGYTQLGFGGPKAFIFPYVGDLRLDAPVSSILELTGSLTIECLCYYIPDQAHDSNICGFYGISGEGTFLNPLYDLAFRCNVSGPSYLEYVHKQGSVFRRALTNAAGGISITGKGGFFHVVCTRTGATSVKFYVNGTLTASGLASGGATDYSDGRFRVGALLPAAGLERSVGALSSLKIIDRDLTAEEVADEYARTLGRAYPRVSP